MVTETSALPSLPDVRTGNGYDVHRFGSGDHVMLCGVAIPHDKTLSGHSDADVGLHALTDALLAISATISRRPTRNGRIRPRRCFSNMPRTSSAMLAARS